MVLEVSASPKPGNVGPRRGHGGTRHEHFVASALACRPALEGAAREGRGLGRWFRRAVEASVAAQPGGNTHFGTLLLLVPLAAGAGRARGPAAVRSRAHRLIRRSTAEDAAGFYRAFRAAPVRVAPFAGPLDLRNPRAAAAARRSGTTLYDAVTLAAPRDRVAKEWSNGFAECGWAASRLAARLGRSGWNEGVVRTYLDLLARAPDSLVAVKAGAAAAERVRRRARALRRAPLRRLERWDGELAARGINPGSTADILVAGIFLWLLGR
jgi:triphosphoribosyl-dephospho-CoA synthase